MTRENAAKVLANVAALISRDKSLGRKLVSRINEMLDKCLDDDLFGTDGQLDPRGDRRNEG
jgi:hypothetical protein